MVTIIPTKHQHVTVSMLTLAFSSKLTERLAWLETLSLVYFLEEK